MPWCIPSLYFCLRDESKQEILWQYTLECLEKYISNNILKEAFPSADQALLGIPKDTTTQDEHNTDITTGDVDDLEMQTEKPTVEETSHLASQEPAEKSTKRDPSTRTSEDGVRLSEGQLEDKPAEDSKLGMPSERQGDVPQPSEETSSATTLPPTQIIESDDNKEKLPEEAKTFEAKHSADYTSQTEEIVQTREFGCMFIDRLAIYMSLKYTKCNNQQTGKCLCAKVI